ncbi:MAG: phage tail protein [Rhodothalassiaceae bacterium]
MATLALTALTKIAFATAAAGLRYAISRVAGSGTRSITGPRLDDLTVQSDVYGSPLPLLFGHVRTGGHIIWSSGLIESTQRDRQGGKGGGGSTDTQTYTYSVSFAVAISARPISGLGRIWADGQLLRDAAGTLAVPGSVRIYHGTDDQMPDPLIEAAEGTDSAPAFRGLAYILFEDLALGDYGNGIPFLSFEIFADTDPVAAAQLYRHALGPMLPLTTVEALDGGADGLRLSGAATGRQALETLLTLAPAQLVARPGGYAVRREPDAASLIISGEQTAARGETRGADDLTVRRRSEAGGRAAEVALSYADPARDFQPGLQRASRQRAQGARPVSVEVPATLAADRAKALAGRLLRDSWRAADTALIRLPIRYGMLEPGDRIAVTDLGCSDAWQLLIDRVTIGPGLVELETTVIAAPAADLPLPADAGRIPAQNVPSRAQPRLVVLDVPLLPGRRDTAAQFELLAALGPSAGEAWGGGSVYLSEDGGETYGFVGQAAGPAVLGVVVALPQPGPTTHWDEGNTVRVRLDDANAALESHTRLAVFNGANLALAGSEILQFRNAAQQSDGSWILSGLLRGRGGTEPEMETHQVGEPFVLLRSGDLVGQEVALAKRGVPVKLKAVPRYGALEDAAAVDMIPQARMLRPLAPVHPRLTARADGALVLSWRRRSRIDAGWQDGTDLPLGEGLEAYEVEVLDPDGAVVRTLAVATPSALLTSAMVQADFQGRPADLSFRVFQISAFVGRGAALQASLPVPPIP